MNLQNFQQKIDTLNQNIEELDRSRFKTFTYDPKKNEEIMKQMRTLKTERDDLIKQMEGK